MPDSLLEPGERTFLAALNELGIPYLIIGAGAAVMQGAPVVHRTAMLLDLDGLPVRVLPLERVIASKRAAGRPKDLAVLPALEAALAVQLDEARRDK